LAGLTASIYNDSRGTESVLFLSLFILSWIIVLGDLSGVVSKASTSEELETVELFDTRLCLLLLFFLGFFGVFCAEFREVIVGFLSSVTSTFFLISGVSVRA
jgi:hypothetical protein